MNIQDIYQDRGIMKWNGFYLSEHSKLIDATLKKTTNLPLPKMDLTEIDYLYSVAITQKKVVSIQTEERDITGSYRPNIIGYITKADEMGFWVADTKIHYDEVRNIQIITPKKWSDMSEEL